MQLNEHNPADQAIACEMYLNVLFAIACDHTLPDDVRNFWPSESKLRAMVRDCGIDAVCQEIDRLYAVHPSASLLPGEPGLILRAAARHIARESATQN